MFHMYSLLDKIVNKAIKILSRYKDKREKQSYVDGIRASYKKLANKKELTKEQQDEIQNFYKRLLGHSIPTDWHKYFYARTGNYSKYYLPTSEYKTDIIGRLNVFPLKRAYTDKNISDILLPNAHQPKIFLKNMNGYFYFDGKAVSQQDAIELCKNLGEAIIKPSLSSRGNGVQILHIENGFIDKDKQIRIEDVFKSYISDFQLEEVVHQHKDMSALNPTSLNTIRLLTFRNDMDIIVLYTVVRIGRKGQQVDNESAGGISTQIKTDGTLGKYAYGAPGNDRIEFTDSGIKLEGYKIPSYQEAIQKVKEYHLKFPYFRLMAWDIAIDEAGLPTLIEFNVTPDLSQSANGPAMGDFTEKILKDAMEKNNTWSRIGETAMWKRNIGKYIKFDK